MRSLLITIVLLTGLAPSSHKPDAQARDHSHAASFDVYLLHEKQPPVWLRLALPTTDDIDLRVRTLPAAQPASAALSRALLTALDANRDGKLSESEARKASMLLEHLDSDGDGCLTPLELVPDLPTATGGGPRRRFAVIAVRTGTKESSWLDDVLAHYDRNDDGVLSRDEIDLGAEFDRLDTDRNGKLSPKELAGWFARRSPLALALKLDGPRQSRTVAGTELDVACTQAPGDDPLAGGVKKDKRRVWTLWVVPGRRGWFECLDRDQDGQLSLAELRGAWDRLADESARKRGWLALPEAKGSAYTLTAMPGAVGRYGVRLDRPEKPSTRGPDWFRAMDRNGDGFVSRAEFLGTKEAFDRLDRDGDGLISPEEAEAATPRKNGRGEKKE